MRTLSKLVAILAVVGATATLRADTGPTGTNNASTGKDASDKPHAGPVLSVSDMQARMVQLREQISKDGQHMLYLKEQAKKQKDVIKLGCVNDKLIQLNAEQNIADTISDQLGAALARGSDDRQALYAQLTSTAESVKRLREEAAACVGEPELYKQESGNHTERPDLPDDPTVYDPFGVEIEPPGYSSPFD